MKISIEQPKQEVLTCYHMALTLGPARKIERIEERERKVGKN